MPEWWNNADIVNVTSYLSLWVYCSFVYFSNWIQYLFIRINWMRILKQRNVIVLDFISIFLFEVDVEFSFYIKTCHLFQSHKMTFFRWMKYNYIFESNVDRFTLLLAKRGLKKPLFLPETMLISILYLYI